MQRKQITIAMVTLIFVGLVALYIGSSEKSNKDATEPTMAVIKPVSEGPDYLRLEQVHPDVIARFLLTCIDGRVYWNAGIVTTPELSASVLNKATKNYLEIDDEQLLIALGSADAKAVDSTLWIMRPLDATQVIALKNAHTLGAWTEDGSDFRWGAFMHIGNVRGEIKSYVENCKK